MVRVGEYGTFRADQRTLGRKKALALGTLIGLTACLAISVNLISPSSQPILEEDLELTRADVESIVQQDLSKFAAAHALKARETELAASHARVVKTTHAHTKQTTQKQSSKAKDTVSVAAAKPSTTTIAARTGVAAVATEARASPKASKTSLAAQPAKGKRQTHAAKLEQELQAEKARVTALEKNDKMQKKSTLKKLAALKAEVQSLKKKHEQKVSAPQPAVHAKAKPKKTAALANVLRNGHDYAHDADMDAIFGSSSAEELDAEEDKPVWKQALQEEKATSIDSDLTPAEEGSHLHDISKVNVKATLAHLKTLPGIPKLSKSKLTLDDNDEKGLISELTDAHDLRLAMHDHKLSPVALKLQSALSALKATDASHDHDLAITNPKVKLALKNPLKSELLIQDT
jgi:hypothetical protein